MTETQNHYPQVIAESCEFASIFPSLSFQEIKSFFHSHYDNKDSLDETKFNNSLRMGFFKANDYSANLKY